MSIQIGDKVKVISCGDSGGKFNPRWEEQKSMVGNIYTIEEQQYGYNVITKNNYRWHFSDKELEKLPVNNCDKCGHELVDSK